MGTRPSAVIGNNSNQYMKQKTIYKYMKHSLSIFLIKSKQNQIDPNPNQIYKSSCWSRFGLSRTQQKAVSDETSVLPELIMMMSKLPSFTLLILLQVTFSVQLLQENPEATSLENVKDNFLTQDLIIKRFYVVLSLQVN